MRPLALQKSLPELDRELERRDLIVREHLEEMLLSLSVLFSKEAQEQFLSFTVADQTIAQIRAKLAEFHESERAKPTMHRVPRKKYIGPIADGPSSPWFHQALGADYAWWLEQAGKFRQGDLIPQFDLVVYEAGNFADAKRTLAEIEDAVSAEYGDLPQGFIEGMFDRLAKVGLVEWVEKPKGEKK